MTARGYVDMFRQDAGTVILGVHADDCCCVQHGDEVRVEASDRMSLLQPVLLAINLGGDHEEQAAAGCVLRLYARKFP